MEANNSQLVIYQTPDGNMSIDVTVENETVWLSQGQMAELFDKDQSVIARHIANVFKEGEFKNLQALYNPEDYNITKSVAGVFSVNVEPELVFVYQFDNDEPIPLRESEMYRRWSNI